MLLLLNTYVKNKIVANYL